MKKCKIYALYLPQFHQTKENDEWWGVGFTEWNAVKSAKKYSRFSRQPRIPLNGYYDLSKVEDIKYQAEIARKYSVDGFAIYHYYSNGKILLGKPAELLLNNKDINIEYFFSWANHDWRRTWYGYNYEILQKQEYGTKQQIIEHYYYLRDHFKDSRYLKIKNKPVFSIYKADYIPNINEYKEIWTELANTDGFDGIYFIQTIDNSTLSRNEETFDAAFDFEPGCTILGTQMSKYRMFNKVRSFLIKKMKIGSVAQIYDYRVVSKKITDRVYSDDKHYFGVFSGWDNTPRHKKMGTVYKHESISEFENLFSNQYKKAVARNQELLLINSWNEWSEGAYLEPDTYSKYGLLEAINRTVKEYEEEL